jgi:mannose-6-phosphate isomerase-like protein (cupin superfamily)
MNTTAFTLSEIEKVRESLGESWHEFLNLPSLSMGLYRIAAGENDRESHSPHDQDEIYVGVSGHGLLSAGGVVYEAGAGSIVYVRAGVEHHFHDVTEDLCVLVFFAGRADAGNGESE